MDGKPFDKTDFIQFPLKKEDYENCLFKSCNMAGADLSAIRFSDCRFVDCDLSNANIRKTSLQEISFAGCKMLGLHFHHCDKFLFSASFENSRLDLCSFYKMNMKKARFVNCRFAETDFTECDLHSALFSGCDLGRAVFFNTILEKADLRTSWNYSINPEDNRIKKARFSKETITGLLDKYDIEIS
ncbi:MAG: pentapeptide repeat-containing protein [Bacteroidia bacterium]